MAASPKSSPRRSRPPTARPTSRPRSTAYIRERNITCDFLFWLCKNRPEVYGKLIEPQLFMAILSVLEKDQFSEIKKGHETLRARPRRQAPHRRDPQGRAGPRRAGHHPRHPAQPRLRGTRQALAPRRDHQALPRSAGHGRRTDKGSTPDAKIIVSWPSLKRRQDELEEIVTKKIPQNSKDIGIARGYGDLKENHEFKSAREMQGILTRQKAELELDLARAEGDRIRQRPTSARSRSAPR